MDRMTAMDGKLIFYVVISLLGGAIVPLQLAIVNAFRESTQATQIQSTFYLYVGGMLASLLLCYVMDGGVKPPAVGQASWWMWLPGFLGSFYILFMFIAAPKIGASNTLLWVFLGQMYIAILLGLTGWFGLEVRPISMSKVIGLLLVTAGGLTMIYGEAKGV
ncbi:DMT family transporter [Psychrobacter aestuarii]|nr:DMT family transporter [Psychrobacter aestuarii]